MLSRHAAYHLAFKPGSDVAMLNAMIHTIIEEGLTDEQYIAGYTEGFEDLKERIKDFSPEHMEPVCGIPAQTLREVARLYARSRAAHHLLGHGHQPARAWHRQCALPDRPGADHRSGRPTGHRAASVARPEQCAGRIRRRTDPDGVPGLSVGREPQDS